MALSKLMPIVYDELRKISSYYLRQEHGKHTLQTTELVHEAFVKLAGSDASAWKNKTHFFAAAANSMRQILVDYARKKKAVKRGGGERRITLHNLEIQGTTEEDEILALDQALSKLSKIDSRAGRIVELRYFSGLTIEETAEVLKVSVSTVKRDWNFARAWLHKELKSLLN